METRLWIFFTEDVDGNETVISQQYCKCPDLTTTYKGMQRKGWVDGIYRYGYRLATGDDLKGFVSTKVN